jgi:hypothetical protein
MIARKFAAQSGQYGCNLIRFHGENQHVCEFQNVSVGRSGFAADFPGESLPRSVVRVASDDVFWADESGVNEAAGERGGHFARAEETDG